MLNSTTTEVNLMKFKFYKSHHDITSKLAIVISAKRISERGKNEKFTECREENKPGGVMERKRRY